MCGIIDWMTLDLGGEVERLTSARLAGPAASLSFLEMVTGVWAVACGALAGSQGLPQRAALASLGYVLLLVGLGWAAGWQLIAGTDWFHPLRYAWPAARPAALPRLPYTQPGSPAGRLWRGAGRLVSWWREAFWPGVGPALVGLAIASTLVVVFSLLLHRAGRLSADELRFLGAAFVALSGLGLAWRRHEHDWPAGKALVTVGLPWLAAQLVVAEPATGPTVVALLATAAWWGTERLARGLRGGGLLIGLGQAGVMAWLVVVKQPLAAGAVGALWLVQLALVPAAAGGAAEPRSVADRLRRWQLAVMLLAALALP